MFPESVYDRLVKKSDDFERLILTAYSRTDSALDKNTIDISFSYRFKKKCPEWYEY